MNEIANQIKFNIGNNIYRKYKVEAIQENIIYAKKSKLGHYLSKPHYLVL